MRICSTVFLGFLTFSICAQTIEGRIIDGTDNTPLTGANVVEKGSNSYAISDAGGFFRIEDLAPGRSQLEVSFVGYKTAVISNIWVKTGKTVNLTIPLELDPYQLGEVIIKSTNPVVGPGRRTIDEEQINRFAATYYDPARLMTTSPDVAVINDQNNQVSVRGISPNYNLWRLEGAEIVNPNHLSNAGTITDQPAGSSGGVNILSAQVLGVSSFHYGAFDNTLGNSVGGIFDMYLKEGISSDYQFTTQASLIGFDLSADGPIVADGKASFITNYRYSFTGLLTNFGIDFGGESIGFQDLSVIVSIPFKDNGRIKIFGSGGLNFNDFEHKEFSKSEKEKDRNDIYYDGKMGLVGTRLDYGRFGATIIGSGFKNKRVQSSYNDLDLVVSNVAAKRNESLLSTNFSYTIPLLFGTYDIGVVNNYYTYGSVREGLSRLYLNSLLDFRRVTISMGFSISTNDTDDPVFDPRIMVEYQVSNPVMFYVGMGRYSQLLKPSNHYYLSIPDEEPYTVLDNYGFIRSDRFTGGIVFNTDIFSLQTELFYYHFPKVNTIVSLADTVNEDPDAASVGISLTANKDFSNLWYVLAGVNLFNSQYGGSGNNTYNTKHNFNFSIGKEFKREKNESLRTLSFNMKTLWQGGIYYFDIPALDAVPFPEPSDLASLGEFESRLGSYFRVDFRLQRTKSHPGFTSIIALDIQNIFNRENEGYVYYDNFLNEKQTSLQLGLIPILTYRLEF